MHPGSSAVPAPEPTAHEDSEGGALHVAKAGGSAGLTACVAFGPSVGIEKSGVSGRSFSSPTSLDGGRAM